jgi:predicted HTH transcriptional regulator
MDGNRELDSHTAGIFRNIFVQLLVQPVEVVEGDELEIKGWCDSEKEFAEKIVESACCIANATGGIVLGGIEGKKATFSSCPYPNVNVSWIETRVKNGSFPPVDCRVFDLSQVLRELTGKPDANAYGLTIPRKHCLTSHVTSRGVSKVRRGKECQPYFTTADDDRTRTIVQGASTGDLSLESLKWALARHQKKFNLAATDDDLLVFAARIHVIAPPDDSQREFAEYNLTLAALLLFGKERALEKLHTSTETIVAFGSERQRLARNIVESVRELVMAERSPVKMRCSNISQDMLLELLMNAYIHRDWRTPGPVMIRLSEILEIQSPGELLPGLNVMSLLRCIPCYRNFLLAESCRQIGLCDKAGRGIGLIFDSALRGGLDIPIFESANNAFTARLSLNKSENFAEFVRVRSGSLSSIDEILCLRALLDREDMTSEEIAQVLQRAVRDAQKVLAEMEKKLMVYKTNAARFALAHGVRTDIEKIFQGNQLDMFQ